MVAGILRQNGYTVFEAGTGAEACAIFSKHAAAIHLVFCDLVLPDMPGVEVIGTLKACNPGTKVLVTTGYGAERTPLIPPACQHYRFLKKPYSVADLLRAMREVIDAPASA